MKVDFIGEIVREPDPPGISKRQWINLIREHPNLVPPEPREAINPFTKQPMIIRPTPDIAHVDIDGREVGVIGWAEDNSNLIQVFGEPQFVIPLAREIAKRVGGHFREWTDEGPESQSAN